MSMIDAMSDILLRRSGCCKWFGVTRELIKQHLITYIKNVC